LHNEEKEKVQLPVTHRSASASMATDPAAFVAAAAVPSGDLLDKAGTKLLGQPLLP
jgi:hypothetical protein